MFGLREQFEYLECAACGCLQIKQPPAEIGKYYPRDYYAYSSPKLHPTSKWKQVIRRARTAESLDGSSMLGRLFNRVLGPRHLSLWMQHANLTLDCRILDVGSGTGHLLARMSDWGFTHLTGIDPFIPGNMELGPVKILKRSLSEMDPHFDFIMFHHSYEHMEAPETTLKEAAKLLAPGGTILIRIPVADCFAWRHFATDWVQLDAPRHITIQTRRSMDILAKKSGFQIQKVIYDSSSFQFWGSEQYQRDVPLMDPASYAVCPNGSGYSKEKIEEYATRAAQLNAREEGDQACFFLQHAVP